MTDAVLSLMVLTLLLLLGGAWWLWREGRARKQALLMVVLAAVLAVNVAIWTVPDDSGDTLASASPDR
ncbi:MAG: hypothetical protein KDE32_13750 [Novosphingobium sp.]|nr:hypothetical protein [Novosphingobium sp.]